jgi:23S rRNA U2552 (ribose-2'-O)-methylase RlmE/FtsJ
VAAISLTEIANEEGTDKGTIGPTDLWPAQNYTDIYQAYLDGLRDRPITLVEIGLGVDGPNWRAYMAQGRNAQGGASMRMWYRYFTRARILGIDVNPASFLDNDRVTTCVADQGDPEQLQDLLASRGIDRVDVIIDDGSHRPDHQQISFSTLFPCLVPGGLYFIEDLSENGKGDEARGRHASQSVLNTRRVLRGFARDGVFPEPHAIADHEALARSIAQVSFHCPSVLAERTMGHWVRRALSAGTGAPGPRRFRFATGEERLCVVHKR